MHLGLGDAYAELDRDHESLASLRRAVELDPASKWAQANLGSVLLRCGQLQQAEEHCRAALAIDPDMPAAHQYLAGILYDRGEIDEARRHRDASYRGRNVRIERAPNPEAVVLLLTTSHSGNIPHRYLLPNSRFTRIDWFIEYAGEGQAAELPAYDIVFNIIGDADYSQDTEAPVAAFLAGCERPWLNQPDKVARTRRDLLPSLLGDIDGVVTPKAVRVLRGEGPAEALAPPGPLLIRPTGSHGGQGLALLGSAEELAGIDIGEGGYLTEFVDYSSPADGRYRKYRAFFVDRKPYPYHLAIKDGWLVHYYSAEMTGDEARQVEELRFLEDPEAALGGRAAAALAAIGERLDLDFAGVDFSVLPDGRLVVFEANATMLVHPEAAGEFAYKNPHVARITSAFQDLIARRRSQA
jgi:hypothetical protein